MTSKKQLRAEIERLTIKMGERWWKGFEFAAIRGREDVMMLSSGYGLPFDTAPWAEHLARVADAAKDEGYREGYGQACEGKYAEGYRAGMVEADKISSEFGRPRITAEPLLTTVPLNGKPGLMWLHGPDGCELSFTPPSWPLHPQPKPEATPEPVEPADGQVNAFSADCGFFCHCAGPRPDVWQPGSVTR